MITEKRSRSAGKGEEARVIADPMGLTVSYEREAYAYCVDKDYHLKFSIKLVSTLLESHGGLPARG